MKNSTNPISAKIWGRHQECTFANGIKALGYGNPLAIFDTKTNEAYILTPDSWRDHYNPKDIISGKVWAMRQNPTKVIKIEGYQIDEKPNELIKTN